jgi:hypothetical protein
MERIVYTPLSREFLLKRGYCCNNGCKNCPYNYKKEIMNGNKARPHPSVEQIIAFNRKQYSASIDGPGIQIEKEEIIRPETRNIPKELFTWTPPKTTAWVKEYIDTHGKPPIYKIKLKYLEYVILPVNGPYHAKGQPPRLGYDPATSHESFWEELITSIRKTGQRTPVNVYQQVNDNGEIHWRVLDGQHRCNALLDIYGPEYEVDCSLDSNMENYITPYLYLDKFGTHIKDNTLHNYHPTDNADDTDKWKSGRSENDPVTQWNNRKNEDSYDDGVCEGEYVHPTQAEIIEHNRNHCSDYISLSNYTEKMTLVPENLLEKLKDFDYWKEWKNK